MSVWYEERLSVMLMHTPPACHGCYRSLLMLTLQAFFNLAQAKQALGPARVGPASFRLGRIEPLMTV